MSRKMKRVFRCPVQPSDLSPATLPLLNGDDRNTRVVFSNIQRGWLFRLHARLDCPYIQLIYPKADVANGTRQQLSHCPFISGQRGVKRLLQN